MKGKLPITSECILESCEEQWRLLMSGVLNELKTSMTLSLPGQPGKTVRIGLVITEIWPPESMLTSFESDTTLINDDAHIVDSVKRSFELLIRKCIKNKWVFLGYIDQGARIPLTILYYPNLHTFAYSQQLASDKRLVVQPMMN